MPTIRLTWRLLKQNIREAIHNIQQRELQQVSEICIKEFRPVSQQRADFRTSSMMVSIILIAIFD
jgi:hypothetical protein